MQEAQRALDDKKYKHAIRLFSNLLIEDTKNSAAYCGLAKAYYKTNQLSEAESNVSKAIEIESSSLKPYLVLYCIKHKQRSDKNVLYQIAQKAYEIAPNDPMALNNLGLANFAIGDKDEAIRFLELSIQSDPKSSVPHKNLCFIYTQLKMMDLAFQEAREAYRLDRSIQSGYILFFRLLNKNRIIAKILMNFLVIFFVIAFFVSLFSVFIWERLWLVVFPVVYLLLLLRNGINFLRQKLYFKGIVRITIVLASFVIFAFEIKRLDF